MTTIKLKNGSGAPTSGDLVQGEPALDLTNKRLYTENASGTVIEVGTNPGASGAVTLNHSGSAKLATTATGVDVTGVITTDGMTTSGNVDFGDSDIARFGAGNDLQIYHDGANSYIEEAGTGSLFIRGTSLILEDAGGNDYIAMTDTGTGGTVEIKHNAATKLTTTSTGIDVTGTATMDGLTLASGSQITIGVFGTSGLQLIGNSGGDSIVGTLGGSESLILRTASTERMRIDSSGNVGIGTSSPDRQLSLKHASQAEIGFKTGSVSNGALIYYNDSENKLLLRAEETADHIAFQTGGTTERMRIDSSGLVGIGNSSASSFTGASAQNLVVGSGSGHAGMTVYSGTTSVGGLAFADGTSAGSHYRGLVQYRHSEDAMLLYTSETERMRIDSSGTLNLGTTLNVFGGADRYGYNFYANGQSNQSIDGTGSAVAQYINRENDDGPFTEYYKDRVKVGSIGTTGGDMYVGTGDCAIRFSDGGDQIRVCTNTGSNRDGAIDLGFTDSRFKDLYLSGTAKIGAAQLRATGNIEVGGYNGGTDYGIVFTPADGSSHWHVYNDAGGHLAFGHSATVGSSEKMRLDTSGNLLVGCTALPSSGAGGAGFEAGQSGGRTILQLGTTVTTTEAVARFYNPNGAVGSISLSGSATAYNTSSDQRLKDNIVDAPSASDDIDAIQVRSFDWKADGSHQKYGMVAQELQSVAPEAVTGDADSDDMMGVDYSKLVPMMLKEIQSLRARVAQLEGEN